MKKGKLITLEGNEGAGKTTALKVIKHTLDAWGVKYITTREPGGEPIAEKIRDILLHSESLHAKTELLLMFASRNEHIQNVIKPELKKGTWVISDRYVDASYAYQGGGRELGFDRVKYFDDFIVGDWQADLTFLLNINPEIGMQRVAKRGKKDRIEKEGMEFFHRISESYIQKAKINSGRYEIIDASQTIRKVREQIQHSLSKHQDRLL